MFFYAEKYAEKGTRSVRHQSSLLKSPEALVFNHISKTNSKNNNTFALPNTKGKDGWFPSTFLILLISSPLGYDHKFQTKEALRVCKWMGIITEIRCLVKAKYSTRENRMLERKEQPLDRQREKSTLHRKNKDNSSDW